MLKKPSIWYIWSTLPPPKKHSRFHWSGSCRSAATNKLPWGVIACDKFPLKYGSAASVFLFSLGQQETTLELRSSAKTKAVWCQSSRLNSPTFDSSTTMCPLAFFSWAPKIADHSVRHRLFGWCLYGLAGTLSSESESEARRARRGWRLTDADAPTLNFRTSWIWHSNSIPLGPKDWAICCRWFKVQLAKDWKSMCDKRKHISVLLSFEALAHLKRDSRTTSSLLTFKSSRFKIRCSCKPLIFRKSSFNIHSWKFVATCCSQANRNSGKSQICCCKITKASWLSMEAHKRVWIVIANLSKP